MKSVIQKNIQHHLTKGGLSVRDLERRANLSPGSAYNILIGRSKNPTLALICSIAKAFGCSVEDLINSDNYKNQISSAEPLKKWLDILQTQSWNITLATDAINFIHRYLSIHTTQANAGQVLACVLEIYSYSYSEHNCCIDEKFAEWVAEKMFQN
jgi:transcriptional regulator with XRE-family HTH domain